MLAGSRLGDDAPLAEAAREDRLAERVVRLLREDVQEILALQVEPLARGETLGARQRGRPAGEGPTEVVELGVERTSAWPRARPSSSSSAGMSVSGT